MNHLKGVSISPFSFFKIFWRLFIIEKQRETEHEHGRGQELGRHRIWSRLQALSCQHRAWHGVQTHKPWDHDLSQSQTLNWLSHPGAPAGFFQSEWVARICDRFHHLTWSHVFKKVESSCPEWVFNLLGEQQNSQNSQPRCRKDMKRQQCWTARA